MLKAATSSYVYYANSGGGEKGGSGKPVVADPEIMYARVTRCTTGPEKSSTSVCSLVSSSS